MANLATLCTAPGNPAARKHYLFYPWNILDIKKQKNSKKEHSSPFSLGNMVILPIFSGFWGHFGPFSPPPKGQIGTKFFFMLLVICLSVWKIGLKIKYQQHNFSLSRLWCFLYIVIYLHWPIFGQKPFFSTPGAPDEFSWYPKNSFSGVFSIGRRCKKVTGFLFFVKNLIRGL